MSNRAMLPHDMLLPWVLASKAARLLGRFWPQLTCLCLLGIVGNTLINELAVSIGRLNSLAGLSVLAFVVLFKLVIIAALFETVRPGLPALDAAAHAEGGSYDIRSEGGGFATALAMALVPFFGFYAAWGFLGDTIREYSKLSLDLADLGEKSNALEVTGGSWLIVSVCAAWLIRRLAKFAHRRSKAPIWPVIIVLCEANWAFVAMFVISQWQSEIRSWISQVPEWLGGMFDALFSVRAALAQPSLPPPAEAVPPPLWDRLVSVFFYGLYPVVWMALAALVYGYDINGSKPPADGRFAQAISRWQTLPKAIRDFVSHFIAGTVKRYRALAEGVGLTLNSGFVLIVSAILLYRITDWGAAWTWYGAAQVIGSQDLALWQIIAGIISLGLGSPSAPGDGVLVMPIKVCLLAAALEIGFARGRHWSFRVH